MGTRNLTAVKINNEYKIAQYGQWDGYISGQGATVFDFLQTLISNNQVDKFKLQLSKCSFETAKDIKEKQAFDISICENNPTTLRYSSEYWDIYKAKYPFDSRDVCAKILQEVLDSELSSIVLQDNLNFAENSLFCEYAYIIDFDSNTFEIYTGYNQIALPETDRFYNSSFNSTSARGDVYYPVKLLKSYALDNLPLTLEDFTKECEALEA
jgi:hypothetical protein